MSRFSTTVTLGVILILVAATPAAADSDDDDSRFGAWSTPINLGATINSAAGEFGPALSPDGNSLYFGSNRAGGSGLADIWVTQRANKNAPWEAPVNLGPTVNSAAMDNVPNFSRDGHWMFFNSNRAGGLGGNDIWVSFRANPNDDFAWQTPTNLGAPINSAFFDAGPALVEHGNQEILYFNSDRPGTGVQGSQEFYASVRQKDGSFGTPMLVAELNSASAEQRLTIRKDAREAFFFSDRPGSAVTDLWTSSREDRDAAWGTPTKLSINSAGTDAQPTLSRDGRTLVFASDRGTLGNFDLYISTRTKGGN
jgi:Tol biopolymer transport system component